MNRIRATVKAVVLAATAMGCVIVNASGTQNLNVTASVTATCKFSSAVQTFTFGTLDPSAAILTSGSGASVTYRCTKGTVATGVTAGNGGNASGGTRRMSNGTDFIPYSLNVAGGTQTGTGFGGAANDLSLTLTGSVLAADYENVSSGSYSDTVLLSVTP